MNFAERRRHEDADDDQGRCRDLSRNDRQEGRENHAEAKENGDDNGRKARPGTDGDTGRRFDVSGSRCRSHDGPAEHGKRIGHEGFPDAGHLAILHDAGLLSKTNQGSGRIEEGDQEEDDDDGPHLRVGDDGAHVGDADAEGRFQARSHGNDAVRQGDEISDKAQTIP